MLSWNGQNPIDYDADDHDSACLLRSIWCTRYAQDHQIKISMNWAVRPLSTHFTTSLNRKLCFSDNCGRLLQDKALFEIGKFSHCKNFTMLAWLAVSVQIVGAQLPCTLSCVNDSIMYCVGLAENSLQPQARSALGYESKMRMKSILPSVEN